MDNPHLAAVAAFLEWADKCSPDPDYSCGAAYCDGPACNTHNQRKDADA